MSNVTPYVPVGQSDQGTPRIAGQHGDIFPGSPMALVAMYVEIVRARFRDENRLDLPYYWDPDPTPNPRDTNDADAGLRGGANTATKVYIESAFTNNADARNFRPAIFVDKGLTVSSQIAVGNRAAIDLPSRTQLFIDHEITAMKVDVVSTERGQSGTLADHVYRYLKGIRDEIRATFGVHSISALTLNETMVFRRTASDNEAWSTPITFDVTCKAMWKTRPVAPLLQQIRVDLVSAGAMTSVNVIGEIDARSRRRGP